MSPRRAGESSIPASEREPFTARLSPEAKRKLQALAQIRGEHAYEVIEEAFWRLWDDLAEGERQSADMLIRLVDEARKHQS